MQTRAVRKHNKGESGGMGVIGRQGGGESRGCCRRVFTSYGKFLKEQHIGEEGQMRGGGSGGTASGCAIGGGYFCERKFIEEGFAIESSNGPGGTLQDMGISWSEVGMLGLGGISGRDENQSKKKK